MFTRPTLQLETRSRKNEAPRLPEVSLSTLHRTPAHIWSPTVCTGSGNTLAVLMYVNNRRGERQDTLDRDAAVTQPLKKKCVCSPWASFHCEWTGNTTLATEHWIKSTLKTTRTIHLCEIISQAVPRDVFSSAFLNSFGAIMHQEHGLNHTCHDRISSCHDGCSLKKDGATPPLFQD